MAQQAPLSTSLRVQNSRGQPADARQRVPRFAQHPRPPPSAIDPRFRDGYAQNWQLSVQRDLRFALQMVATYLGIKGTRGVQQFLPNTFPAGAVNPCAACPSGFSYMTSNGNSTRHAGTLQLRRRLRQGLAAEVQYTWAKGLDDAALGGSGFLIAQNWLDLRAERGPLQLRPAPRGRLPGAIHHRRGFRRIPRPAAPALSSANGPSSPSSISAPACRLPRRPSHPCSGTGVTGSIRANYTGADPYAAPAGLHLNPAAYARPRAGPVGQRGPQLHHRPGAVQPERLRRPHLPLGRPSERRPPGGRHQRPQSSAYSPVGTPSSPARNSAFPNPAGPMRTLQTTLRVRF